MLMRKRPTCKDFSTFLEINNPAPMVKNELRKDPFTGTVFVFRARTADRLKLLYWDGIGLVMAYKRLEEHSFTWPAVKDGLMLRTMRRSRR